VAVILDEIQAIRDLDEPRVDWLLRDLMQSATSVSFICAGSQPSVVHAMTEDDQAFYRFFTPGPLFGPIDPVHMATWIAHRMTTAGVECGADTATVVVERAGDRTQDILLLAQETFQSALSQGRASDETVEAALVSVVAREADRYRAVWDGLTRNQKLVVRALASGVEDPFSHGAVPELPGSSVQRSLESLRAKKLLLDAPSTYRLDDPYFVAWVRRHAMSDSVPREVLE
jgi:hypothetical protein